MHDNAAQKASPSYRLAVEDRDFLLRDEMRALRFGMLSGASDILGACPCNRMRNGGEAKAFRYSSPVQHDLLPDAESSEANFMRPNT
jgi:hypothetical protein